MAKAIQEISVDTRLLYQRLLKLEAGEMVSYSALSEVIGRDVAGVARSSLASARRMALRDGIVTAPVIRSGIKRLTDSENVESTGIEARQRIRRAAQRAASKLLAVDPAALAPAQKIKQNAELSQLGAIKAFSSDKITKRLDQLIDKEAPSQLALAKTLDAFK